MATLIFIMVFIGVEVRLHFFTKDIEEIAIDVQKLENTIKILAIRQETLFEYYSLISEKEKVCHSH